MLQTSESQPYLCSGDHNCSAPCVRTFDVPFVRLFAAVHGCTQTDHEKPTSSYVDCSLIYQSPVVNPPTWTLRALLSLILLQDWVFELNEGLVYRSLFIFTPAVSQKSHLWSHAPSPLYHPISSERGSTLTRMSAMRPVGLHWRRCRPPDFPGRASRPFSQSSAHSLFSLTAQHTPHFSPSEKMSQVAHRSFMKCWFAVKVGRNSLLITARIEFRIKSNPLTF